MEKSLEPDGCLLVPNNYFQRLRPDEIFAGVAERPLEIDLGSGDGGFLVAMAAHFPDRNFLGVERLLGRVRKTCRKAARAGLTNAKVLRLESAYTVEWLLPMRSVARLHLLFPDPWPKKRHQRRRLVNSEFLRALSGVLKIDGDFCFKTDDPECFEAAVEAVEQSGRFREVDWPKPEVYYAETDFESHWLAEGKGILRRRWRPVEGTAEPIASPGG